MKALALDNLSPEIWLCIAEQLYSLKPEFFSQLRLVSRNLNELAVPFVYRSIKLHQNILDPSAERFSEDAAGQIKTHVKYVLIEGIMDWDLAARFLMKCRQLKTLTWEIIMRHSRDTHFPEQLKKLLENSPDVGLNIHNCIYDQFLPGAFSQLQSIPAANLHSFEVSALGQSGYYTSPHAFQDFLIASTRLETLTFNSALPFQPGRGRLPPIKSLTLTTLPWNHSSSNVKRIWNFSKLEDLHIPGLVLHPFLDSVPPEDLNRLRCLQVDDTCWPTPWLDAIPQYSKNEGLTQLLSRLLQSRCDFQDLDIRCILGSFDVSLISKQGSSLESLKLLDLAGFEEEGTFPTISPSDLKMIQVSCTRLSKLDIGINVIGGEMTTFLNLVSGFGALRYLTIYVQSRLNESNVDTIVEDIDRQSAIEIKDILIPMKVGAPLSNLSINVGGWREKGNPPRRCGTNWDHRRGRGRNPERMFVWEHDQSRTYSFQELRHSWIKPWL